jgi:rhodanese-related sulfurtransferase
MKKSGDLAEVVQVRPLKAFEMLRSDKTTVLLDVRSKMEFDYVGHPLGAINVPWQNPPAWQLNPEFLQQVRDELKKNNPSLGPEETMILAMCRSGKRSFDAATFLLENGFKKVINIEEGFEGNLDSNKHRGNINGWRHHQLPWEQT